MKGQIVQLSPLYIVRDFLFVDPELEFSFDWILVELIDQKHIPSLHIDKYNGYSKRSEVISLKEPIRVKANSLHGYLNILRKELFPCSGILNFKVFSDSTRCELLPNHLLDISYSSIDLNIDSDINSLKPLTIKIENIGYSVYVSDIDVYNYMLKEQTIDVDINKAKKKPATKSKYRYRGRFNPYRNSSKILFWGYMIIMFILYYLINS